MSRPPLKHRQRASVLIIVLWISFGLVALALYFAHSMSFELRSADNRVASLEAEQAIAGAVRYVSNILATVPEPGLLPSVQTYYTENVPVGDAAFWLVGRPERQTQPDQPAFGLIDEASKLNLNTATLEMLQMLPGMTPELAGAIIDWRDTDTTVNAAGGAETDVYQRLNPSYRCKDKPFESIDELRLVYGMDMYLLAGEDANRNGVLDPNENDSDTSAPYDNRDGRLDPGILEYVTVWSREPNTRTNGAQRVNVGGPTQTELATLLEEKGFSTDRANQILQSVGSSGGGGGGPGGGGQGGPGGGAGTTTASFRSVLEFYYRSSTNQNGLTPDEFAQIEGDLTVSTNSAATGLINVNTASEAVLACVPGIGIEYASSLVGYRQSNRAGFSYSSSMAWVTEVLGQTNIVQAGPYLTGRSYQIMADIVALGHHGRGYQRVRTLFDTTEGIPRIAYRQDMTHLGWALGKDIRKTLLLAKDKR